LFFSPCSISLFTYLNQEFFMNHVQLTRKALNKLNAVRARVIHQSAALTAATSLSLLSGVASAQTTAADFTAVTTLLQTFVTFMTGPFGKAAVVISIIAAFVTWVFAPKEGIFGPILRVVVAGIAIMNAALWITSFGGATAIAL
jgi:type IV secretory pathway VirB2 component (pilin)